MKNFLLILISTFILISCAPKAQLEKEKFQREHPRFECIYSEQNMWYIYRDNQTGKRYLCVFNVSWAAISPLLEK